MAFLRWTLSAVLPIALIVAVGCNSCTNQTAKKSGSYFRYNQASGIASLDPAFAKDQATIWACNQLYNSLVQLDDELKIQPSLAKSWDVSEDGLLYTFHLRTDVSFHNDSCFVNSKGRVLNAADVVYSFNRIIDTKVASPGAWIFNGNVAETNAFVALNDSTFQLRLTKQFPPMLGILSMQYCSVIPKEAVTYYGAGFRAHPVGTGPFLFKSWKEGTALILHKNSNYFETLNGQRLPFIDGIKVSFIDNKKTEFLAFKQKELDFVSGIDASYIDEVLDDNGEMKTELKNKFQLLKTPYLNTEYLGFLMDNNPTNPLSNVLVRKAINYGFDRQEMLRYLRNGVGRAAVNGFTPYGLPSFSDTLTGFSYNPNKARELLKQAGYPDGKGMPTVKLYTNETYKEYALFVSKQLEQIGIKVQLEIAQPAILREWMSQGKAAFFRGSWLADYPDAENYFAVFYGKNGSPPNYTRFNDVRFNKLYEEALAATTEAVRYKLYMQMEQIIIEQAPVVPLYYDEVLRFSQNNIEGLTPNALNLLQLKRVKVK